MNRILLTALIALIAMTTEAKRKIHPAQTFIYRYYLHDKAASKYDLQHPEKFLSEKSLHRRMVQHLSLDSTDLPVPRAYVRQFAVKGTKVLGTSRWQNTVLVKSGDSLLLEGLATLPIVDKALCVYVSPDSIEAPDEVKWMVKESFNRWDSVHNDHYGIGRDQIEMLGGVRMHEAGFTGKGVTIAILDGGFQNYHKIPAFAKTRILGTRDVVEGTPLNTQNPRSPESTQSPAFHQIDHGTKVLSAMAANAPEVMVGTAPDASFWLIRTEENSTEQPVEEDYWTMGAELADSLGADIINSSLGYHTYDEPLTSYRLRDLDGQTAFVSRSASLLAQKGIVLCNSAGNSGMGTWKKIGVPADAKGILTVGAVDADGKLAPFSSVGPTQDGRTKPDIVARGSNTTLLSGRGTLIHDMGTSFSTPVICGMVACLRQALPDIPAAQLIELVRQSANQHEAPDNIYGYGIPNFWTAYSTGLNSLPPINSCNPF